MKITSVRCRHQHTVSVDVTDEDIDVHIDYGRGPKARLVRVTASSSDGTHLRLSGRGYQININGSVGNRERNVYTIRDADLPTHLIAAIRLAMTAQGVCAEDGV